MYMYIPPGVRQSGDACFPRIWRDLDLDLEHFDDRIDDFNIFH